MIIWKIPRTYGIVFKRGLCEWILPYELQGHISKHYNPRHVPVPIQHVYIKPDGVDVYEYSKFEIEPYVTTYNRLVYSWSPSNEDVYLQMSKTRIEDGYRYRMSSAELMPQVQL